jgi:hypothetical protein
MHTACFEVRVKAAVSIQLVRAVCCCLMPIALCYLPAYYACRSNACYSTSIYSTMYTLRTSNQSAGHAVATAVTVALSLSLLVVPALGL